MQTFLPSSSFSESAKILDYRRLGKQRCEAQQILNALQSGGGWRHHPAVKMWRGYEDALRLYLTEMILEWKRRGYVNNMAIPTVTGEVEMPPWLGDRAFHASHRSNLLRKNPAFYGQYGWTEPNDLAYVWP